MLLALLLFSAGMLESPGLPASNGAEAVRQAYTYYLIGIDVTGARRLSRQQVIALSQLKAGRSVTAADLEAATARLAGTGLFDKVAYRIRTTGGGYSIVVTFTVQEAIWQGPVFFDNFVGIPDPQLTQAVARAVPSFDGVVPEAPAALERVRSALEQAAVEAGQPGTVSFILISDDALGLRRYRFHLDRAAGPLRVCRVTIETKLDALRDQMTAKTTALVGSDYSRDYVIRHAMQNVVPMAARRGYLQARVRDAEAIREMAATDGCGVSVTVLMEDGPQYKWRSATWSGATLLRPADLDRLLGLHTGDVADAGKIADGQQAIRGAYGSKGYLDVRVQGDPSFDTTRQEVAYAFRIEEGPQFRMGTVQIAGLDAETAERVKSLWTIAEGEIYDASYTLRFVADTRAKLRNVLPKSPPAEISVKADRQRLRIDVSIAFKPAS